MTTTCPRCGFAVQPDATRCPQCGIPTAAGLNAGPIDLVLTRLDDGSSQWRISQDEAIVGRSATADVSLPFGEISRSHSRLARTDEGGFAVEDAGSQNGTFVNGRRISGRETLREGDILRVADVELRVGYVAAAPSLTAGGGEDDTPRRGTMFVGVSRVMAAASTLPVDEPATAAMASEPDNVVPVDDEETGPLPASAAPPDNPLDLLVASASSFMEAFQRLRPGLIGLQEAARSVGGAEAIDELLARAAAVRGNPESVNSLTALGERATELHTLLQAAAALAKQLAEDSAAAES